MRPESEFTDSLYKLFPQGIENTKDGIHHALHLLGTLGITILGILKVRLYKGKGGFKSTPIAWTGLEYLNEFGQIVENKVDRTEKIRIMDAAEKRNLRLGEYANDFYKSYGSSSII